MPRLKQFVPQKVCLACQGCCRFGSPDTVWSPRLLPREGEQLLENNIPPAVISPDGKIRLVPGEGTDTFYCAFFSPEGNTCKVYSARPLECQLYPFLINRSPAGKVFIAVDTGCPFIQKKLQSREFKEHLRYVRDFLCTPASLAIIQDNPWIIQSYEGAQDLSELII